MGLFDDMSVLLGRGMNAADRKTQSIKLQSELSRLEPMKESELAKLGRAVLTGEATNSGFIAKYSAHINAIGDIEARQEAVRQQIEALKDESNLVYGTAAQTVNAQPATYTCPACGASVTLDADYCSNCGDNLETLKAQHRQCPVCGTFYPADALFCENDGGRTEDLTVAPPRLKPSVVPEGAEADSENAEAASPAEPVSSETSEPGEVEKSDTEAVGGASEQATVKISEETGFAQETPELAVDESPITADTPDATTEEPDTEVKTTEEALEETDAVGNTLEATSEETHEAEVSTEEVAASEEAIVTAHASDETASAYENPQVTAEEALAADAVPAETLKKDGAEKMVQEATAAEEAPEKVVGFCSSCGAKLKPGALFCGQCGTRI